MENPVVELRPDGPANCFIDGRLWKRIEKGQGNDANALWYRVVWRDTKHKLIRAASRRAILLEKTYQGGKCVREIERFPRSPEPERIARLRDIPRVRAVAIDTTRWLVNGMVPEASITLLTALPGGYKTWFALSLAGAVAEGAEFLGRKTAQSMVLYLDYENPLSVIRERLAILRLHDGEWLKIWGHWLKDPPPQIGDRRLDEIARRHRPLIIFDSFLRFHSAEENSATQMASVLAKLRRLTVAGASIFPLHHLAKSQRSQYRGSSDILAAVDAAFTLSKKKNKHQTILTLECFKHRLVEEFELTLRPDFQNGRFELLDDPSAAITSTLINRVRAAIAKNPGITQQELIKRCGIPETNGRDLLLREAGNFWFTKRGEKKSLRYYLTEEGAT